MKKIIGYVLIFLALGIVVYVIYFNTNYSQKVRTFSTYTLLSSSWAQYKNKYINTDGRVLDYSQNNITTSEGQSYAMLRSVFVDDKDEFDKVWKWTKDTLKRPRDNLFGWRWGKKPNGTYGFIENGGDNAASDADSDIALALILASRRWNEASYLDQAKPIVRDIWNFETVQVQGKRYLIAGNWANSSNSIIINPSYFSPYAWRTFSEVDRSHNWNSLIQPAYTLLFDSGQLPLYKNKGVGLAPDWIAMDKKTGALLPTTIESLTTNYSYDAMRIPWRIFIDYKWNEEKRARDYLEFACKKLQEDYTTHGKIASSYAHNGDSINSNESPAMYGASIGCFLTQGKEYAKSLYEEKIVRLYSNDKNTFNDNLSYYDQNWVWFGAALYNNAIVNFEK